jgi:hypothetical protein
VNVLLDTCVVSEARHPKGNPRVRDALKQHRDEELFLSVLTVGELDGPDSEGGSPLTGPFELAVHCDAD